VTEPVKGKTDAGRRREERARQRREHVVEAATQLFLEHGYVATTIEAIARAAAVAPATVYQAFGTKQAILARILDVTIAGDADPAALLDRDWVRQAARHQDPRQRLLEDDRRRYLTQQALVDLIIGAGSLRPGCDRDQAAATFFALVNSHGYQLLATQLGWSPDDWQRWLAGVLDRELFGPG
jgi:AcrR family transcriptional regulator